MFKVKNKTTRTIVYFEQINVSRVKVCKNWSPFIRDRLDYRFPKFKDEKTSGRM